MLRSRFGFMAIHGGGLEQMTDVIAERAADAADASLYVVRHPDHYPHHLPSARYRAAESERLAEFLEHVDVAVSLHGYGRIGRSTQLLAGGRNRALAEHLARHVSVPGYQVVTDIDAIPRELRGLHPDNPVNRVRGGGTQLELTPRVRGISPRSQLPGDDGISPATSALVQGLVATARSWETRPGLIPTHGPSGPAAAPNSGMWKVPTPSNAPSPSSAAAYQAWSPPMSWHPATA